jgi:hypothetical protein
LQEDVEGIFNKNCGIDYPSTSLVNVATIELTPWLSDFKFSFTIWALGKAAHYLRDADSQLGQEKTNGMVDGR